MKSQTVPNNIIHVVFNNKLRNYEAKGTISLWLVLINLQTMFMELVRFAINITFHQPQTHKICELGIVKDRVLFETNFSVFNLILAKSGICGFCFVAPQLFYSTYMSEGRRAVAAVKNQQHT